MEVLTRGRSGADKRKSLIRFISLRGWRRRSFNSRPVGCAIAIAMMRLRRCRSWPDSSEADNDWEQAPAAIVPHGYFAVYVGPDRKRFIVKTEHVNHPLFRTLLDEAEKEFGFENLGPLTLPCEVSVFRRILWVLNTHVCDRGSAAAVVSTTVYTELINEADRAYEFLGIYAH